nr:receptor-interacting serine/threonine-protein kinase 4 isoform X2 [Halyomorpha halys]
MWLTSPSMTLKALSSDARIITAIQYATQSSIYPPENTAAEMTTAQTIIISFLYALKERNLQLIKMLLEVSSTVPQIKSSFLSVWLRDDFSFPRGDIAISLSTLGKLLFEGLQFPWAIAATLSSLDVKYCIRECFVEVDDTAGQLLLSTMNSCVSKCTQVDFEKTLLSKESQTNLMKHVSFQLPVEKSSIGTQAGLIVHDRGVSAKPEQSTTGVQTIDQPENYPGMRAGIRFDLQSTPVNTYGSLQGFQAIPEAHCRPMQTTPLFINDQSLYSRDSVKQGQSTTRVQPEAHCRPMQTAPLLINDQSLYSRDSDKQEQSTTRVQAEARAGSMQTTPYTRNPVSQQESTSKVQSEAGTDSGFGAGTGFGLQTMPINAYGSLPMPKKKARNIKIIDPSTGRDIIEDYLSDTQNFLRKETAKTLKTTSPSDSPSLNSSEETELASCMASLSTMKPTTKVEDAMKNFIGNTGSVSNKGMANELLYSAIQKNDAKSIVTAINAGADVNHEGVMKKRPLHVAASAGRIEPAIELIHWGADVDSLDHWGETPLFVASVAGHFLMAEVLVAAGANINHRNSEGNCPLHVAASAGQLEIIRLLLSSGAQVDCRGESLRTPLHCAAFRGHLSVVSLLLDQGADPKSIDQSGHTPLTLAKTYQQHLVADFLYYRSRE